MSSFTSHEVIIASSPSGLITAYDASNGIAIAQFSICQSPCHSLTMAGQGLIVASDVSPNTGACSIHLYNWYTAMVFNKITVSEPLHPLYVTSDGAFLFAGGVSGTVHSMSLPSGDVIKSFVAHSKSVSSLQVSDDGSFLVSGSEDGTIVVTPTFKLIKEGENDPKDLILYQWRAHLHSVTGLGFGTGICSSTLVSSSVDCTCKFWSLTNRTLIRIVTFPCAIVGIVMDSTKSVLYAGDEDGSVYKGMMKDGTWKVLRKHYEFDTFSKTKRRGGSITALVLVNEGRNLVSSADDGSVWAWDVEKEDMIMVMENNFP